MFRRVLFQLHLWVGVAAGLYLLVVCLTGASLLFRPEMQNAAYPQLFVPLTQGALVDPATVIRNVAATWPTARVSGIDAPTTLRATYLAYVSTGDRFLTVLIDPVSGAILGEMPDDGAIRTLQSLHFNLLAGTTGRRVNGVGAVCLLLLVLSGLVVWWPGRRQLRSRLTVRTDRGWSLACRDLHSAVAIWVFLPLIMWSLTGFYFAFPAQFRAGVGWISATTRASTPKSNPAATAPTAAAAAANVPDYRHLLEVAQGESPDLHIARVVLPRNVNDPLQVMFAAEQPTTAGSMALSSVYLDRYSGRVLTQPPGGPRTLGDVVMLWAAPLHVGNFGGNTIRALWLLLALAPPLLAVTGLFRWWTRVVLRRRPV